MTSRGMSCVFVAGVWGGLMGVSRQSYAAIRNAWLEWKGQFADE